LLDTYFKLENLIKFSYFSRILSSKLIFSYRWFKDLQSRSSDR